MNTAGNKLPSKFEYSLNSRKKSTLSDYLKGKFFISTNE